MPYPPPQSCSAARSPAPDVNGAAEAFAQDARNLLTALTLYADLVNVPGVLPPGRRHYGTDLRLLADRGTALLGSVLASAHCAADPAAIAEAQAAGMLPGRRPGHCAEPLCDPAVVLRRCLPLLQAQTGGAADVVLRLPRETPPLPVSGESLERITAHLVCEAAEAMRAARRSDAAERSTGTVWIALQARDSAVRLCVEDSGPGLPTGRSALFPPAGAGEFSFSASGASYGTMHHLVTATGGRVAIRPRPAGGTVVTVCWPLAQPSAARLFLETSAGALGRTAIAC